MTARFKRMTISITRELFERMETRPDVNWSEVARYAFEGVLAQMDPAAKLESEVEDLASDLAVRDTRARDAHLLRLKRQYEVVHGRSARGGRAQRPTPRFAVWLSPKVGLAVRTIEQALQRAAEEAAKVGL